MWVVTLLVALVLPYASHGFYFKHDTQMFAASPIEAHFQCHCNNDAQCDLHTGACPYECDQGVVRKNGTTYWQGKWEGPGCQAGNVAFKEVVTATRIGDHFKKDVPHLTDGIYDLPPNLFHDPDFLDVVITVYLRKLYVIKNINIQLTYEPQGRQKIKPYKSGGYDDLVCNGYHWKKWIHTKCDELEGAKSRARFELTGWHIPSTTEIQVYAYRYHQCHLKRYGAGCLTECDTMCVNKCHEITGKCRCKKGFRWTPDKKECIAENIVDREIKNDELRHLTDSFDSTCVISTADSPGWYTIQLTGRFPISHVDIVGRFRRGVYGMHATVQSSGHNKAGPLTAQNRCNHPIQRRGSAEVTFVCSNDGKAKYGTAIHLYLFHRYNYGTVICGVKVFAEKSKMVVIGNEYFANTANSELFASYVERPQPEKVDLERDSVLILAGTTKIGFDGYVTAWHYNVSHTMARYQYGKLVFSVWRPVGRHQYNFVGAVMVDGSTAGPHVNYASNFGTVNVHAGDRLGIGWSDDNSSTVEITRASEDNCDEDPTWIGDMSLESASLHKPIIGNVFQRGNTNCPVWTFPVRVVVAQVPNALKWRQRMSRDVPTGPETVVPLPSYYLDLGAELDNAFCRMTCVRKNPPCRSYYLSNGKCKLFDFAIDDTGIETKRVLNPDGSVSDIFLNHYKVYETPVIHLSVSQPRFSVGIQLTLTCNASPIWPPPAHGMFYLIDNRMGVLLPDNMRLDTYDVTLKGRRSYDVGPSEEVTYEAEFSYVHVAQAGDHDLEITCVYEPEGAEPVYSKSIRFEYALDSNYMLASSVAGGGNLTPTPVYAYAGVMSLLVGFDLFISYKLLMLNIKYQRRKHVRLM